MRSKNVSVAAHLQVSCWLIRANNTKNYYVVQLHIPAHAEEKTLCGIL